jgi:ectoine hydroxylase-related dioxygenase (phytanoyl-CoA dioxygenase family)
MLAVSRFSKDNGATLVVPGSHKWPKDRRPEQCEITQAEMDVGSMLLWMGSILHAAGENRTDHERFGAFFSYSLGWLRQKENQFRTVFPNVARDLSEQLQRFVSYSMHARGWDTSEE